MFPLLTAAAADLLTTPLAAQVPLCRGCVTDVDELEGSYGHLPENTTARLPLLVLDGE